MQTRTIVRIMALGTVFVTSSTLAYDCTGLPEWKRQHYYLLGDQVQYQAIAYQNTAEASKRDRPDNGDPWLPLGTCDTDDGSETGGGGGGGGGGSTDVPLQPLSIYGVWHCGNSFCDWSQIRDVQEGGEFDHANRWIVDRGDGRPSVNLVVLSFLKPMELLLGTTNNVFHDGIPVGMTKDVVNYFKRRDIRVLLSLGGVTYTDSWNRALLADPAALALNAAAAVDALDADGVEIDWENGRPSELEMAGMETFIRVFNEHSPHVLTLDLAVGNRYLQELSRRAANDWLPSGQIDYVNAMVPRGEPDTAQWQEHVDGKAQYDPPILPKPPAKVAVSLWLTNSRKAHPNCVSFDTSPQLEKANFVQTVLPNGAGETHGFVGLMFWAAECPATRNVCTTPPNSCENGMGAGASYFDIPIPLYFSDLRTK